jgi:hypothetical protein
MVGGDHFKNVAIEIPKEEALAGTLAPRRDQLGTMPYETLSQCRKLGLRIGHGDMPAELLLEQRWFKIRDINQV